MNIPQIPAPWSLILGVVALAIVIIATVVWARKEKKKGG